MGELTALEELFAHGNQLKAIPVDLAKCTQLRFLNLGKNEVRGPILWVNDCQG